MSDSDIARTNRKIKCIYCGEWKGILELIDYEADHWAHHEFVMKEAAIDDWYDLNGARS